MADPPRPAPALPAAAVGDVLVLPELVLLITRHVGAGDMLAWALACKGFRAAQQRAQHNTRPWQQRRGSGGGGGAAGARSVAGGGRGVIVTPVREFLSLPRVEWIVARDAHGVHMVPDPADQRGFCNVAARAGDVECLQALIQFGMPWGLETLRAAGLEWWSAWICEWAAQRGALVALKWARAQGCPWDEGTCRVAAEGGHLEVLQWAHEHGCPWDEETCWWAATRGHAEMLRWLRAKDGCPCGGVFCIQHWE